MGSTWPRRRRRSRNKIKKRPHSPASTVSPTKLRIVFNGQDVYPRRQTGSGGQERFIIRSKSSSDDLSNLQRDGFLSLDYDVHDVSRTEHHLPNARKFLEKLDAAWKPRWQTRHSQTYQKVSCLLMRWEEETMRVKEETDDLSSVLRETYHFGVEDFLLPSSEDRYIKIVQKVHTFINENNSEGNLILLYYGGHAEQNRESQPIWYSGSLTNPVDFESDVIFAGLKRISADALLLFDSCQALPKDFKSSGKGAVSVIAATGFEPSVVGIAPVPGPDSFSRSLIDELIVLSRPNAPCQPPPSFSDIDLHARIISRLMCYAPAPLRNEDGSFMRDENDQHMIELPRRRTPIYRFLTRGQTGRPICLAPLLSSNAVGFRTPSSDQSPQPPGDSNSGSPADASELVPYALIKVQLQKNGFEKADISEWAKWILKAPSGAVGVQVGTGEVTIESFYQSCSTMLIVKLPTYVWSWMEKGPSITFLGYVSGDNQAASVNEKIMMEVGGAEIERPSQLDETCTAEVSASICDSGIELMTRDSNVEGDRTFPGRQTHLGVVEDFDADRSFDIWRELDLTCLDGLIVPDTKESRAQEIFNYLRDLAKEEALGLDYSCPDDNLKEGIVEDESTRAVVDLGESSVSRGRPTNPLQKRGLAMRTEADKTGTVPVPRLNCYFLQKDFDRYSHCSSCNGKGFEGHNRLNEHIKKHHVNADKPTTIETIEQLDNNLKRQAEALQKQKEKEKEKEERRKRKECPKELSSHQFYKIFGRPGPLATKNSLGSIWLDMFDLLFHDRPASVRPFKPYIEQVLFYARHPSPEFKAWSEKHHRLGSPFESQLGVMPMVVSWLSLTGGLPSGSGTPDLLQTRI